MLRGFGSLIVIVFAVAATLAPGGSAAAGKWPPIDPNRDCFINIPTPESNPQLYTKHVACAKAKKWARAMATSGGKDKPDGWRCIDAGLNDYRRAGFCQKKKAPFRKQFGWHYTVPE